MRTANAVRGEVALVLAGASQVMRPSFQALVAAEAELGSLFAMLERAAAGEVRLTDMAGLFWHCLADSNEERSVFEERLLAAGPSALLPAYRRLLAAIFGGG